MKLRSCRTIPVLATFLAIGISCNQGANEVVSPSVRGNLLVNPSFELGDTASTYGWHKRFALVPESLAIMFDTDVPSGGGRFSVALRNSWGRGSSLSTYVLPENGRYVYELAVWAKYPSADLGWASIGLQKRDISGYWTFKSISFRDTVWTRFSILDTIDTAANDIIMISLIASPDQFAIRYTLFDLCTFSLVQ